MPTQHHKGFQQLQNRETPNPEIRQLFQLVKKHSLTVTNWKMTGTMRKVFYMEITNQNAEIIATGEFRKRSHAKNEDAAIQSALKQLAKCQPHTLSPNPAPKNYPNL